ncbi:hypothetical protein Hanom_Chr11g01015051 [Helianthus anomalus]
MRTSQTWKLPTCGFTNSDTSNMRFINSDKFQHASIFLTCGILFFFHVHANLPPIQKTTCCIPGIRML